jgi:hypothetical protein
MGTIFQTCIGPSCVNCPILNSIKKTGMAPKISTVKYGMINAPEIKEVLCDLIKIKIETNKFLETNLKISSSS